MNTLQKQVADFMEKTGWSYWSSDKMIAKLEEEVGETKLEILGTPIDTEKFKREIGDVLFAVGCILNKFEFDADECLQMAIKKNWDRDVVGGGKK
jgi:NTP pyrophosphatase (non-canonical NTP hydrolase)